ncbi:MAG: exodeoxyribonuclease III [Endomicrobium sp.]|jgi:exodeoxyribonuclease-3|nr:exodeoxyribonuclease III [Endomicrobium sp.]
MKIVSWNVNGIRSICKKGFNDWVHKSKADIVCIQETKANEFQFPITVKKIDGYYFYCSCAFKKGYSGVAVWSRIKPKFVYTDIKNSIFDNEGRIICLDFDDFFLFNIYFPNGRASQERFDYKLRFYDHFIEHINSLKNKMIVICGDYNTAHFPIDLARPNENKNISGFMIEERKKLDDIVSIGFVDTFRYFNNNSGNYTWWDYKSNARSKNIGWRIDYFFMSKRYIKYLKSTSIDNYVFGSDHCPISIDIF